MGSLNEKEKEFKSILSEMEFEVNAEDVWQNISHRLPEKRKSRRPFLFWFSSGISLLTILLFSYYLGNSSLSTEASDIQFSENTTNSVQTNQTDQLIRNAVLTDSPTQTALDVDASTESSQSKMTQLAEAVQNEVNNPSAQQSSNTKLSVATINSNSNERNDVEFEMNQVLDNKVNFNLNKKIQEELVLTHKRNNLFIADDQPSASLTHEHTPSLTLGKEETMMVGFLKNLDALTSEFKLNYERSLILPDYYVPIEVAHRTRVNTKPYIILSTGFNQTLKDVAFIDNTSQWSSSVFESEKALKGFNIDLAFGKPISKSWDVFGGIGYSTQFSVSSNETIEKIESIGTVDGGIIDSNGTFQTVNQEVSTVTTTYNRQRIHRRHKYLDLFVGANKTLFRKNKFRLGLSAALRYNVASNHRGYFYEDEEGSITSFQSQEDSPYKNNTGMTFQFGTSIEWNLKYASIGLTPSYRWRPQSIISDRIYKIKDNSLGLQFFIIMRPFK